MPSFRCGPGRTLRSQGHEDHPRSAGDDHVLVRAGIRSLLGKMTGIEVVTEAGDGREAFELIEKQLPNVVLMDIAIPELNGLEPLARPRAYAMRVGLVPPEEGFQA